MLKFMDPKFNEQCVDEFMKYQERIDVAVASLAKYKEDHRPPRGGWADGHYLRKCFLCQQGFFGDKRAVSCADCAYKEKP